MNSDLPAPADENRHPQHIAVILDGNIRWAKERNKSGYAGHLAGLDAGECFLNNCLKHKIKYVTMFALSIENAQRPKHEISFILELLTYFLNKNRLYWSSRNVRFGFIGDINLMPTLIRDTLQKVEQDTKNCDGLYLNIALYYSGKWDIAQACSRLLKKRAENIEYSNYAQPVKADEFTLYLSTSHFPDPDILIRTGGYERLSNFMLWQLSYTELYFLKTLWPAFDEKEFESVLADFKCRKRNFGSRRR